MTQYKNKKSMLALYKEKKMKKLKEIDYNEMLSSLRRKQKIIESKIDKLMILANNNDNDVIRMIEQHCSQIYREGENVAMTVSQQELPQVLSNLEALNRTYYTLRLSHGTSYCVQRTLSNEGYITFYVDGDKK